jgi:hypothetical protein
VSAAAARWERQTYADACMPHMRLYARCIKPCKTHTRISAYTCVFARERVCARARVRTSLQKSAPWAHAGGTPPHAGNKCECSCTVVETVGACACA